jgi:hypothetical protein
MDSIDSSSAISVYAEAKGEYTKQLCVFLMNPLQKFFLGLLDIARAEEVDKKRVLKKYQELLSQIPDWNIDKVAKETGKIQEESGCDYLEELLTAVFIAHTKVLSAIRLNSKNKSIQITVPKVEHFLHRTLSESARRIWSNVYLFSDSIPSLEKQKNLRQLEIILNECIQQAVRGMLPVKNLLRDYLSEPDGVEQDGGSGGAEEVKDAQPPTEELSTPIMEQSQSQLQTQLQTQEELLTPIAEKPQEAKSENMSEESTPLPPSATPTPPVNSEVSPPTIVVETEPRVHFSNFDTVFKNGKTEIVPSVGDVDEDDDNFNEVLRIHDDVNELSINDFESLDNPAESLEIEYETLD